MFKRRYQEPIKWADEDTYFHDTDLFRFDRLLPTLTCVAGVERDRGWGESEIRMGIRDFLPPLPSLRLPRRLCQPSPTLLLKTSGPKRHPI